MPGLTYDTHTNGVNETSEANGTNGSYASSTSSDASHINGGDGFSELGNRRGVAHFNDANGASNMNPLNGSAHANGANGLLDGVNEVGPNAPIAICGMALRLPGGSASPEEFWEFLINKGDARSRVPESRYNISAYYRDDKRAGAIASEYGYFLDEGVKLGAFDSSRFSLSRAELEFADPQQRRLLEVVREALDDAGDVSFRGKAIGCYVGNMGEDWGEMMNRDPLSHGANRIDGYNDWMLGNRISYEFGLEGPSMTIRTACSSALIGLNEACAAMQRGVCEGAIVAGSTLIMAPGTTQSMSEKGILGPDGSCKTFSADANGYARGEAITAIYVKPLDAAIRDGNPVRAVIRAAMANSDGKTQGITNPNPDAHETMIRKAYAQAGIADFSKTAYFECHGTGTAVGDPIETGAVANIFGDDGIHITSVKPNVGHTEGASGLVSLIKAVSSLENRTIPPNIKFTTPNPRIPFEERKLTVPVEPTPFPEGKHERVSVNSFGLGGSNAHVIVDSAASFGVPEPGRGGGAPAEGPQLLLFSAGSAPSLKRMAAGYEDWLARRPDMADRLGDLAYTLANRREHLAHRAFKVAGGTGDSPASAGRKAPSQPVSLVMVFTGQGAQWPRMGRELLARDDLAFQASVRALDGHLQELAEPPQWTIEKELGKSPRASRVQEAELSQPLCTAVQIGLVDLFAAVGVEPAAVVGHSSGELAAAYAAGALTAKEAIVGAYQRGQAAKLQSRKGAMAAVGLGPDEVEPFLSRPGCVVACENSPKSVTLSGDADEVKAAVERVKAEFPDATARLLKVEKAYHSYHMREIGADYRASIEPHLAGRPPARPFFSSVTGSGEPERRALDAKYWQQNLESPVLFGRAVAGIVASVQNPAFLEVGPHGALAGPARQVFAAAKASPPYASAMARNEDCVETYLKAVGQLFELGVPIDYAALAPAGTCLPALPPYPWNHDGEELWRESRMSREWRFAEFPEHPLLGRRQLESTSLEPSFRNMLGLDEAPWLRDHVIQGAIVFPAAGYLAMAGEAARQLSGAEDSYRLRHVVLSQALLLQEGAETELVTSLRRHRLSDAVDSEWWEFTVASYDGRAWVRHCTGQVSAGSGEPAQARDDAAAPLARKLDRKKLFSTLARAGMQYGPRFRRLDDITAGTAERDAACALTGDLNGDEDRYHLHPTVIDAALQSGLVAARRGQVDAANCAAMPTLLERVEVFRCAPSAGMRVAASTQVRPGEIDGSFRCVADGRVVLDVPEARFTRLDAGAEQQGGHRLPITARVHWRRHIDLLPGAGAELVGPAPGLREWAPLLDEMGALCVVYFQRRAEAAAKLAEDGAVQKFAAWVGRRYEALGEEHPFRALGDEAIVERAHGLGERMAGSPVAPCADGLLEVGGNIDRLLSGETTLAEVLSAGDDDDGDSDGNDNSGGDDKLAALYACAGAADRGAFIRAAAHARPNLRVLEVGASTGGSTAAILADLLLPGGAPLYSRYTYTDATAAPLAAARKRLARFPNLDFRALDIAADPAAQGLEAGGYDLVVAAANALRGEPALVNARALLAPGGRLLLQEPGAGSDWAGALFGLADGWWAGGEGDDDGPPTPDKLRHAGFAPPETVASGTESVPGLTTVTVAQAADPDPDPASEPPPAARLTLLTDDDGAPAAGALAAELRQRGHDVKARALGDELPAGRDVVALLDEGGPFFEGLGEGDRLAALQGALAGLGDAGLLWVTRMCQVRCADPRYAQVLGAARAFRNEELVDFATCEVDGVEDAVAGIADVCAHFAARREDDVFRPECEYAVFDGGVHVPRIYPFELEDEQTEESGDDDDSGRVALEVEKPGRLASLRWVATGAEELAGDQVEVKVFAAGLSAKDVSEALGQAPYPEGGLGMDASGVVSRVGREVRELAVGDRVVRLGAGSLASHAIGPEALCAKIPDSVSFEDAATLPAAYVTAMAALYDAGNLVAGQSVLIHSASGGVGLAALQLARAAGAEVYATVGSDEKARHLADAYDLPPSRIFGSRDAGFAEGVRRETGGRGVDLALNSLSGDLLHATWECVAEFGSVVDVGGRDLAAAGKLDLRPFLGGRGYSGVSLDALAARRPSVAKGLLQSTIRLLEEGRIAALTPRTDFDASSAEEAFRHMQEGQHVGKVVLTVRGADGKPRTGPAAAQAAPHHVKVDPSASYLLAGGLGGIATVIARHLVECGARRLVCLSRNPGSRPEEADAAAELESMGCEIIPVKGDLSSRDDVLEAVRRAPNLRGVLHAPMLLADGNFRDMTAEQWDRVCGPKVRGAWYLHEATAGLALDFFVLLSSMSGLNGQPGQANYAGANTYLDALAQYRNGLGLPAAAIGLGAVADVGYAARDDALLQRLIANGYSGVTQAELVAAFAAAAAFPAGPEGLAAGGGCGEPFVHRNAFASGFGSAVPLGSPESRSWWKRDVRMAVWHNTAGADDAADDASAGSLRAFLATAKADPDALREPEAAGFLAGEIGRHLMALLLRPDDEVDVSLPLTQLGLDSLLGVEMRAWWRQTFGADISVLQLLGLGTLEGLGKRAVEQLLEASAEA